MTHRAAVFDRLLASDLDDATRLLVDTAFDGANAVRGALGAGGGFDRAPRPAPAPAPQGEAWLTGIEVTGWRGVAATARLELAPGPGLTVIHGRNGSGKSSFAEALELLLTGTNQRWAGRKPAKDWQSGWCNLHHQGARRITATFVAPGLPSPTSLTCGWDDGAGLEDGRFAARLGADKVFGDDPLGWRAHTRTHAPLLSYAEIGRALDAGPSRLFDALLGILGLDDVVAAREALVEVRKDRSKADKACRDAVPLLQSALEACPDPRAAQALTAFAGRSVDVPALERLVLGASDPATDAEIHLLQDLARVEAPSQDAVLAVVATLRAAADQAAALVGTGGEADAQLAGVLAELSRWRSRTDARDCPVCERPGGLDDAWERSVADRVQALHERSRHARDVRARLDAASSQAQRLVGIELPWLDLPELDVAREAVGRWADLPPEPVARAEHLLEHHGAVASALAALRLAAEARLLALQAGWRPLEQRLLAWLAEREALHATAEMARRLPTAEAWIKAAEADLRAAAFDPIKQEALATWGLLRQRSNVDLVDVALSGTTTNRRVALAVEVDGRSGDALGVMSQGELHALALSLFLPRLRRADGPFRFIVVDDPVQAMDPAKVDGLARVLADAARTHQVVVFTHDTRLPAAVRRLGFPARHVEVERRPGSLVTTRTVADPAAQSLADARHVLDHAADLGDELAERVVPGLCRVAVEAAARDRVWRTRLAAGQAHEEVDRQLEAAKKTTTLLTLALMGEAHLTDKLYARLNRVDPRLVDTLKELNRGAHERVRTDLHTLHRDAGALVRHLEDGG